MYYLYYYKFKFLGLSLRALIYFITLYKRQILHQELTDYEPWFWSFCKLISEDDYTVTYEYGSFNWNDDKHRNEEKIREGIITIAKMCFKAPDIH